MASANLTFPDPGSPTPPGSFPSDLLSIRDPAVAALGSCLP